MNILTNVTHYTEFLISNKLSTNQFLLLYLLYTERMVKDKTGRIGYTQGTCIYKWHNKGSGWSQAEIEDLCNKDYVIAMKKQYDVGDKKQYGYAIDDLIITDKFNDIMYINTEGAFDEILSLYPDTFNINTQTVFTKAGNLDKVSDEYHKLIKYNLDYHEKIKEIIEFAKLRGMCNMKLENFLTKGVLDSVKRMMEETYERGQDI